MPSTHESAHKPVSSPLDLLQKAVDELDVCVHALTQHFPRPQLVSRKRGPLGRHVQGRSDLMASHLKCVRAVAALNSALLLLEHGQVQDVYALCRIVDEQQEDVAFLSTPLGDGGKPSDDQVRFVKEFYQEEFDDDSPLLHASLERDRVSRRRIRAALARIPLKNANPSDTGALTRSLYNTFSGFVHGAYVHIMEQYDGFRYRTRPSEHPRFEECADALTNYVYRACAATVMVAIRCHDQDVEKKLRETMETLASETGCVPSDDELRQIRARMKKPPVAGA